MPILSFCFPILLRGFGGRSVTNGFIVVSVHLGYNGIIVATIIIRYRHLGWFVGNKARPFVRPLVHPSVVTLVRKYVAT